MNTETKDDIHTIHLEINVSKPTKIVITIKDDTVHQQSKVDTFATTYSKLNNFVRSKNNPRRLKIIFYLSIQT